jgi:nuclear pore complex protein Nup133
MQTLGSTGEEDVVRSFFRKQVLHIDRLLETVYATFQSAVNAAGPAADLSAWVLEANRIFITALRAAALLREHESSIYQVDRLHPMTELWTASDGIIGNLDSLYGATQRLIKDRTRSYGSAVDEAPPAHPTPAALASGSVAAQKDQAVLKHQMAQLAAALCENMEDKLRTSATYVPTDILFRLTNHSRQMNTGTDPSDGLTLAQRWDQMKPRIIRPLGKK